MNRRLSYVPYLFLGNGLMKNHPQPYARGEDIISTRKLLQGIRKNLNAPKHLERQVNSTVKFLATGSTLRYFRVLSLSNLAVRGDLDGRKSHIWAGQAESKCLKRFFIDAVAEERLAVGPCIAKGCIENCGFGEHAFPQLP